MNTNTENLRFKILRCCSGASLLLTPLLIIILLTAKNFYFGTKAQNDALLKDIEQEKVRAANLTLEFTKNQNHQKVLDLRKRYAYNFRYIESKDIITEKEIENL